MGRRHKQGTEKRRAGPLLKMRIKDLGLHKDNIITGPDSHLSWQPGMVNGYKNQWRDGRMDTGTNEGMNEWVQELMKGWMDGHRNQ